MCLSSQLPLDQVLARTPGEEFYVYKQVNKQGDSLVSPSYSYEWKSGENIANATSYPGGFYTLFIKPGVSLEGRRILRLKVRREDVVAGGPDRFLGFEATCIVAKKVTLEQKDYDNALSDESHKIETEAVVSTAKEHVKKAKKTVKKTKSTTDKTVKKTKKAAKKPKIVAKKVLDMPQIVKTTKTVKAAKKQAKKTAKKAAKTVKKAKKTAKKAKK